SQDLINQIDSTGLLTYCFTSPMELDVGFFELFDRRGHRCIHGLGALERATRILGRASELALERNDPRRVSRIGRAVGGGEPCLEFSEPRFVVAVYALRDVFESAHRFLARA